jgi:hypothetical protein
MREPGIYHGIQNADYHADRSAIGNSGLKAVLRSPAYYYGQYLDPAKPESEDKPETAGQRFGNIAHTMLFEPDSFNARYAVGPDVRSRALKAWKDWAKDLPEGVEGIKPGEYAAAKRLRESVLAIPDMRAAFSEGHGEASAYFIDPATGERGKCRPDWAHPVGGEAVVLIDGKTYADASEAEFTRQIARMNYDMQAAWYTDGYEAATRKKVLAFLFLAIESDYPHQCNVMQLDAESLQVGRSKYRRALDQYAQCKALGSWPSYGNAVKLITLPAWAKNKEMSA